MSRSSRVRVSRLDRMSFADDADKLFDRVRVRRWLAPLARFRRKAISILGNGLCRLAKPPQPFEHATPENFAAPRFAKVPTVLAARQPYQRTHSCRGQARGTVWPFLPFVAGCFAKTMIPTREFIRAGARASRWRTPSSNRSAKARRSSPLRVAASA